MNIKNNTNYFKKTDTLKFVGMGLMIVGFLMLWMGWDYLSYILMSVFIPVGLVLFFVGSSGRASDNEIDNDIQRACEGMEVNFEDDRAYSKRVLKHLSPEVAEGYEYYDGLMLTKAKSGTLRSSEYTKSIIYMLSDELYITCRTVSLISEQVSNRIIEIPYDMIDKVEILRDTKDLIFGKKTFKAKTVRLSIEYGGGLSVSMPIHDDVTSDELVRRIYKMAQDFKKAKPTE